MLLSVKPKRGRPFPLNRSNTPHYSGTCKADLQALGPDVFMHTRQSRAQSGKPSEVEDFLMQLMHLFGEGAVVAVGVHGQDGGATQTRGRRRKSEDGVIGDGVFEKKSEV